MRSIHLYKSVRLIFHFGLRLMYIGIPVSLAFFSSRMSYGQSEIPLGSWRLHISYNNIHSITEGDQKIFGASLNGVVAIDQRENSITTYSKVDGLHAGGITAINYDHTTEQLLIAYSDGRIDFIK